MLRLRVGTHIIYIYIYIYISDERNIPEVEMKTSNSSSKTRGAATPRTRITCELFGKQKNPVRVHTHTHTQPTKNIPYTHVAVDTNIVVFRPSEPHQYSINF